MQQLSVLISGFDHYEGVTANPSVEVPAALSSEGGEGFGLSGSDPAFADVDVTISSVSLPVSFANAWPTLREAIEATAPDIVIATGLKHAARGVMLERCATNLMDTHRPDADNAAPKLEPIRANGPAAYWTRLPLRAILADFAHDGIPATLSSDAGTFVCNSLFYQLLDWTASKRHVLSGFVSFPLVAGDAQIQPGGRRGLTMAQLVAAGRSVVRETVRYYRRPSSGDILLD